MKDLGWLGRSGGGPLALPAKRGRQKSRPFAWTTPSLGGNGGRHEDAAVPLLGRHSVPTLERIDEPRPAHPDLSLARSALWLTAAKSLVFAVNIGVPLLLVRQLTVREFGVYKQMFLLLDTALMILPLGFASTAYYFFPRQPASKGNAVTNIGLVYLVMGGLGGLLVALFPHLPATALNSPDLAAYAPTLGLASLFVVGSSFMESVAIANGEARLAAFTLVATRFLRSLLLVAAAVFFRSLQVLAYAAVIHGVLQGAIMLWYIRSRFSEMRSRIRWPLLREQLAYALPFACAGALWWLQGSVHYYFVSYRFGAAAFAIYAVGCFQVPIVNILRESVGAVVLRRVSELQRFGETRQIVVLAAQTVRTMAVFFFPLYALLLVIGREFITVLFTDRYQASWPIFAVSLLLIPLGIASPVVDAVSRSCPERFPTFLKVRAALLVPLLAGLWVAVRQFGLVGVIGVVVSMVLVDRVAMASIAARILGMTWRDRRLFGDVAKLAVAASAAGATTCVARLGLPTHDLTPLALLVVCTGVFSIVFLGAGLLLRVLAPQEREAIRQWVGRMRRVARWRSASQAAPERIWGGGVVQAEPGPTVAVVAPTMKILGGHAVQAEALSRGLRSEGYRIVFVPIDPSFPLGLRWTRRHRYVRTVVNEVCYLATLFRLRQADLVHVFSASYWSFVLAPLPAILMARSLGKRVVLNYHSGEALDHLARWGPLVHPWLRLADEIVVPSEYLQDVFARFGYRARVIRNIVDTSRFAYRERRPLRPRFLSTRNLEPHYRVDNTLEAFALVQRRFPDATLTVAGYGSEEGRLRGLSASLGLKGIRFVGRVEPHSMPRLYGEADIFVNSSVVDNQPVSMLEAFAAGLAVISTRVGGVTALVRDGETGLTVPFGDPGAMADAAIALLQNPEQVTAIARRARQEVEKYTWPYVRDAWAKAYGDADTPASSPGRLTEIGRSAGR